jgi:hypothetical protein
MNRNENESLGEQPGDSLKETIMNTPKRFQLSGFVAAAALLCQLNLYAQVWQTVLDFQFVAGHSSEGFCLAADTMGNVFSGGDGGGATADSGLVLKTDMTQATWYVSDDFNPAPTQDSVDVNSLALDLGRNLYSVGTLWGTSSYSWYVRKSSDSVASWSTVDLFQYALGKGAGALAATSDLSGNVYVSGVAADASGNSHWIVRKSTNGGQTWTVADDLIADSARSIAFVPGLGLFAAGIGPGTKTSSGPWTVRRSVDTGATWTTVDSYQPPKGHTSNAWGVSSDGQGRVYVVGRQTVVVGRSATLQWTVRGSSDGGNTWSTVDAFSYTAGKNSWARAVGRDSAGNMVVIGSALDAQGIDHWLVRRLSQVGWQTVDDFRLALGSNAQAYGTVADAAGNLLVTGYANDGTGIGHWVVRRF